MSKKLPALFFGHGNPMNAIETNQYTNAWVGAVKNIPTPKAILVISAHFETDGIKITANKKLKTIHDFYGFPEELYQVQYSPLGDLDLAKKIQQLIPEAVLDESWGLDHGSWSILTHIYPQAQIPTIQLSINKNHDAVYHFNLAKKLAILRNAGVLIIGSGNVVHNLRLLNWHNNQAYEWAKEFNQTIKTALIGDDIDKIINYSDLPSAKLAVPTTEHFLPLVYILGLKQSDENIEIITDGIELGSISMLSIAIL